MKIHLFPPGSATSQNPTSLPWNFIQRGLPWCSSFSWILPVLLLLLALPIPVEAQYTYTANNGTLTITQYTGPGGDVIIPDTITGLPVTSIGIQAFGYSTSVTNVTIPDSVTNIGVGAF